MNQILIDILKANIGKELSPDIAAHIMVAANQVPTLIPFNVFEKIKPEKHGEFTFSHERLEDIIDEMKPLHQAHWAETEKHRHGLAFNPDYETFFRYERAGRCVVFTLRQEGRLLGNFSLYLDKSMHTKTLLATEDTLFLLPEARKGRVAMRFIAYAENALAMIGVKEISVSVKIVNKAGRFFQMIGYRHVENGLTKVLNLT